PRFAPRRLSACSSSHATAVANTLALSTLIGPRLEGWDYFDSPAPANRRHDGSLHDVILLVLLRQHHCPCALPLRAGLVRQGPSIYALRSIETPGGGGCFLKHNIHGLSQSLSCASVMCSMISCHIKLDVTKLTLSRCINCR